MSAPVSYASAARSATGKDQLDPQSNQPGATSPVSNIITPASQEDEQSSTTPKTAPAPVESESDSHNATAIPSASSSSEADVSADAPSAEFKEPEVTETTSSINKYKVSLTPAPVPKVNAWGVKSTTTSSVPSPAASIISAVEPSPSVSNSPPATSAVSSQPQPAPPLDPMHWPKPDEGTTSVGEKKEAPAPVPAAKARPGKEKWIPLNYTPVTSKPRGNKSSRSGNSGKSSHNQNASASGSNSNHNNGMGSKGRGAGKNFGSKAGSQGKKSDGKSSAKPQTQGSQRTASISSASSNPGKTDAASAKAKSTSTAAPVAPGSNTSGPKKGRNGSSGQHDTANGSASSHHSNGYHNNNHNNHNHHNHHSNNAQHHNNSRNVSGASANGGNFPQQFLPYNNRRSSQMGQYNNPKYFVPDYGMYQMYQQGGIPGQSQYELLVGPVVYQIEYYFSVENLCKDMYLRKQMNSNGWIPLNILASFNRLKALTGGDFNLFLEATNWAPSVEVIGDKIRAAHKWEQWILPASDRLPAGKDEEAPAPPKLVFNPAQAAPFVPKSETTPPSSS